MLRVDEKMGATAEDDELMLVFWRLAGGAVEELLALRVLLLDFVAIFLRKVKITVEDFVAGPRITFGKKMEQRMVDESTLNLTVILHGTTQKRFIVILKATDKVVQSSAKSLVILPCLHARLFDTITWQESTTDSPISPLREKTKT